MERILQSASFHAFNRIVSFAEHQVRVNLRCVHAACARVPLSCDVVLRELLMACVHPIVHILTFTAHRPVGRLYERSPRLRSEFRDLVQPDQRQPPAIRQRGVRLRVRGGQALRAWRLQWIRLVLQHNMLPPSLSPDVSPLSSQKNKRPVPCKMTVPPAPRARPAHFPALSLVPYSAHLSSREQPTSTSCTPSTPPP